jgi:predicted extracellular nuclease
MTMKKTLITLAAGLLPLAAEANLMITAVFDGPITGGLPKGVELYASADIPDLSVYGIGSANNGGGSDGEEFSFPAGSLSAGEYIYVATESPQFTAFFGFPPTYTSSAMSINGDDAIELFENDAVVDIFGEVDVDGTGQPWEYLDGWVYRVSGSTRSSTFDIAQWTLSGRNALDGLSSNTQAQIPLASFAGSTTPPPPPPPEPELSISLISEIQGAGASSPIDGQEVRVQAVVVGDFQDNDADTARNLDGFYLQEEVSDSDNNPLTSEGIFVFNPSTLVDVQLGDLVEVVGTVDEYFGETQIDDVESITVIASDKLDTIEAARIDLYSNTAVTLDQAGKYQPDLEAYEGMLAEFSGAMRITEQFQLDRFNEIKLVAGERPYQYTQFNTPDPVLFSLSQQELGARRITYDDGLNVQNANIGLLDGFQNYTEATAPRMGDFVVTLTGVIDYKWAGNSASRSTWRVRSHTNGANTFQQDSTRPAAPSPVGGNLKVASFNVLNFFTTLDLPGVSTAAGHNPRGADNQAEFDRQLAKLVNAIVALDADLLGLVELENDFDDTNDGSTAIEVLVNAVNAELGSTVYDYVYPGQRFVGTDAIATGFIYKPSVVALASGTTVELLDDTAAALLPGFVGHDFTNEPIFDGVATNRVSVAASFTHLGSGDSFTVAVNHFKSKGSSGLSGASSPNFDQQDGAGFWNARRTLAAQAVNEWLASAVTGLADEDKIILGDLNAYASETPVSYLLNNGYLNVETGANYSFVFDGQIGTLDYLLVSQALKEKLNGVSVWHVNADEADALDYNLDFGKSALYFDATTATRNSDHDPVIIGLDME